MINQHEQKIFIKVNTTKNNNKKNPEITRVIFQITEKIYKNINKNNRAQSPIE
jgi:hypothetical protein